MSIATHDQLTQPAEDPRGEPGTRQRARVPKSWIYRVITVLVVIAFFLLWQYVPEWHVASDNIRFLSRFTISSPENVARDIWQLFNGTNGRPAVWTYLEHTVVASLLGALIGLVLGIIVGIVFAASEALRAIFNPLVSLINSAPRVALIPIVVLLTGPTLTASIISAILVVFFLGFFNALEGAQSVPQAILDNTQLMGARRVKTILLIRLPNALSLIFASLPNVISFSLITVVTTEILTGVTGMGSLIVSSQTSLDSGLSLAVVVILAVVGAILVYLASLARKKTLRWEQRR
jgi:NitT/TauT family transport system permease protein